jgi:hypothetical protein
LFVTIFPFHLYTVWDYSTRLNFYTLLLSYVFIVFLLFLYGAGSSKACFNVFAFKYFGNLFCFLSEACGCGPFVLFVGVFSSVVLVYYNVILFNFCFWIYLCGIGSVVVHILYFSLYSCLSFPCYMCSFIHSFIEIP